MIFGNCNIKIANLYPAIDRSSLGDYYFSVGIEKNFAQKCFDVELTKKIYNDFQDQGRAMFEKVYRSEENMPLFTYSYPYRFFENEKGNLTCLISNLSVPGNACGLDSNCMDDIKKELSYVNDYSKFIEYSPHNIDHPGQCYALLSLLTSWENTIDIIVNSK